MTTLVIDPLWPSTLYVLVAGGVFRSDDAGESWTAASGGLAGPVESLTIDPLTPSTLYAVGVGGVFKTLDAGATWFPTDDGLPEERTSLVLAIDDANPAVLYAMYEYNFESRLFRSTDGGGSWSEVPQIAPQPSQRLSHIPIQLLVTPGTETLHLVGARGIWNRIRFELLRSDDGGRSWSKPVSSCDDIPYPTIVTRLVAHPAFQTTLYAISADTILKTIDGGLNWSDCVSKPAVSFGDTATLAFSRSDPSILYAGRIDGVYRSENDGLDWAAASAGLTSATTTSVAIDPGHPEILYAGTPAGVAKSSDGGRSWTAPVLIDGLPPGDLAVDQSPAALVYATTVDGLFRSDDAGESWANILPLGGWRPKAMAVDPSLPGTLYVGASDACERTAFRTSDGGTTWTPLLGLPYCEFVVDLAIDALNSRTIYAATDYHLMKSSDLGRSWEAIHEGLPRHPGYADFTVAVGSVAVDPFTRGILHAGTPYGLFTTVNGGESWTRTALAEGVRHIAFDPGTPGRVYALTDRGVLESRDNGETWSLLSRGLPASVVVRSFAIEHVASRTLHAATDFGVFSISRVDDGSCGGDCDGDARVTINELNVLVVALLDGWKAPGCGFTDPIRVGNIIVAVRNALDGCNPD